MKIKDNFVLRDVFGEPTVFSTGVLNNENPTTIRLNGTAAFLWTLLEQGAEEDQLVNSLLETYDIDERTAQKAVADVNNALLKAGCLE